MTGLSLSAMCLTLLAVAAWAVGSAQGVTDQPAHNTLSAAEEQAGWKLLFDGHSLEHFRGFRKPAMPDVGWKADNGALWRPPGPGGGDIITREQFTDFEFVCDWKVTPKGNSGIIYRCTEEHDFCWKTGLEMQILDDAGHGDGAKPRTRAGALYDLVACAQSVVRPAGEWNTARVVARGTRIEHWLNGVKVVDIDITSPEYKAAWRDSKWTTMPDAGTRLRGHIALQDHGDEVWFRNLKIRPLE